MIRASFVLALIAALSFAARSFLPDATTLTGSGAALAFGFLLLAALQTGHIFHDLRLPHLTGFILCGAIFGPELLGLITRPMLADLSLVKNVAVGLIGLNAGCELNFRKLRPQIRSIGIVAAVSIAVSAIVLFAFFFAISSRLPFSASLPLGQRAIISLICAHVMCARSPAVVMGIITETKAEGPFTELSLSVVVLADLVTAVTFSFSDTAARAVFPSDGASASVFGALAVHILGSIAAGAGVGAIFALYIRRVGRRIGLFVFAVCFVVAEAGSALNLDPLLLCLSAGLFLENVSPVSGREVVHETEVAATPVFAVFFAVVGAEVHLHAFLSVAVFAVGAALARAAGLLGGTHLGTKIARVEPALSKRLGLAMLPQAGVALGLSNLVKQSFPPWGEQAATLLLGGIVVNELFGPVLYRTALVRAGEVGKRAAHDVGHDAIPDAEASAPGLAVPGGSMPTMPPDF